jgi:hypothetical protein
MLESTQAEEEDVRPLHETHDIHVQIAIAVQNRFLHYISCLVVPSAVDSPYVHKK